MAKIRSCINIDKKIKKRLQKYCIDHDISMSEFFERAARDAVDGGSEPDITCAVARRSMNIIGLDVAVPTDDGMQKLTLTLNNFSGDITDLEIVDVEVAQ